MLSAASSQNEVPLSAATCTSCFRFHCRDHPEKQEAVYCRRPPDQYTRPMLDARSGQLQDQLQSGSSRCCGAGSLFLGCQHPPGTWNFALRLDANPNLNLDLDLDPGSDATSSPHALFVFDSQSFFPLSSYRLHCAEEPALLHYCTALLSLGSGKSTQAAARAISSAPLLEPFFFLSYRSGLISLACLSSLASQPSPASHLPGALRRCLPRFYATTSPLSAAHLLSTDVLRHFNRSISPVRSRAS